MEENSKKEQEMTENIDLEVGMQYVGYDEEMYYDVLEMYVSGGSQKQQDIKNLYETKDWKKYVVEVHSLKSTSLNIGAKTLSAMAYELERAGKEENYELIERENDKTLALYEQVIKEGAKLLEKYKQTCPVKTEEQTADLEPVAAAELLEDIRQMEQFSEDFDSDSVIACLDKLENGICNGIELRTLFEKCRRCAEDFDYDGLQEALQTVHKQIESEVQ